MSALVPEDERLARIDEVIKTFREVDIPHDDELCQKERNYAIQDLEVIKNILRAFIAAEQNTN